MKLVLDSEIEVDGDSEKERAREWGNRGEAEGR